MLVAHNGFAFDYLFLMAEIERHQLKKNLDRAELWFADTLYDARRVSYLSCMHHAYSSAISLTGN